LDPSAFQTGVSLPSLPADHAAALEFGVNKKGKDTQARGFGLSKAVAGGGGLSQTSPESPPPRPRVHPSDTVYWLIEILDSGHGQKARPSMSFSKGSSLVFAVWQSFCLCLLCSILWSILY